MECVLRIADMIGRGDGKKVGQWPLGCTNSKV